MTAGGSTTTYATESTSNRLSQVGGIARSYDAAGNTIDDGNHGYLYSARNRLVEVTQTNASLATYAYNTFGERVCKATAGQCPAATTAGTGYVQFVYDDQGHLLGEYNSAGNRIQETLWLDDTPVAVLRSSNGPTAITAALGGQSAGDAYAFWIEPDHLDTPRVIVNQAHQIVWRWDSDPFGTKPANENPSNLGAFTYNLRFPGQYFDAETGLHYNYFRDYEAEAGRYVESDPAGLDGGINSYLYVDGDALGDVDLTGEAGRSRAGRTAKVKGILDDPKLPRCWKGWVKQELNHAARSDRGMKNTRYLRNPPDLVWRHPSGKESCKGYDYGCTSAQNVSVHDIETRAQGRQGGWFGKNKGR